MDTENQLILETEEKENTSSLILIVFKWLDVIFKVIGAIILAIVVLAVILMILVGTGVLDLNIAC